MKLAKNIMKNLKVVFMGTPEFSVPTLKMLHENTNVQMVVTRSDARQGRRRVLTPSPIKEYALSKELYVVDDNMDDVYKLIKKAKPDLIITAAFGVILPKKILDLAFSINVHASILPKHRGASPIYKAILDGDSETGISIIEMDERMDAGDILKIKRIPIEKEDTLNTLSDKLSLLGPETLKETLEDYVNNNIIKTVQDEKEATYCSYITREDELLNFNKTAEEVINQIRALSDAPYPYITVNNIEMKVIKAKVSNLKGEEGTVIDVSKKSFTIMAKDTGVEILRVQPKGKKEMDSLDFLNGVNKKELLNSNVN